tara:strand:- start:2000 stop:2644 length:645 start_codon:yes stop_codon:yes gene_type:complete
MVASIDNLKSTISSRGGIARPNNFLVELPSLPGFSRASDPLNILCTRASIPSKQILTTDRRIGMEFEKIAYGYAVDDVSLTFLVTNDYYVKKYFDRWKDFIIGEDRQIAAYKNDYQAKVVIHQLRNSIPRTAFDIQVGSLPIGIDVTNFLNSLTAKAGVNVGLTTYSVELIDAFPTTISAIEFNNQPDAFVELNIQMSYTNFKRAESSQISFKL